MFIGDRKNVIAILRKLQGRLCSYSFDGSETEFCDCKYSYDANTLQPFSFGTSEQSGCPEVRSAIEALEALTDAEYEGIIKRRGNVLSFR